MNRSRRWGLIRDASVEIGIVEVLDAITQSGGQILSSVLERMCRRADLRSPFGRPLSEQGVTLERIAKSRILIDQSRLLTLNAAWMMDTVGNKVARSEIAMIKVAAPEMACQVIDWAMQVLGGGGTNNDYFLGSAYATARLLRLADGPDEVHRNQIARLELSRHRGTDPAQTGGGAAVLTTTRGRGDRRRRTGPPLLRPWDTRL